VQVRRVSVDALEWKSIRDFLAALDPEDDPTDGIVLEFYNHNPEAFPEVEDVVAMAEQVMEAYGPEEDLGSPDHPPAPLYDDDRWCCDFCRREHEARCSTPAICI